MRKLASRNAVNSERSRWKLRLKSIWMCHHTHTIPVLFYYFTKWYASGMSVSIEILLLSMFSWYFSLASQNESALWFDLLPLFNMKGAVKYLSEGCLPPVHSMEDRDISVISGLAEICLPLCYYLLMTHLNLFGNDYLAAKTSAKNILSRWRLLDVIYSEIRSSFYVFYFYIHTASFYILFPQ